jgi:uncharacterized membrane protein (DUF373 family)
MVSKGQAIGGERFRTGRYASTDLGDDSGFLRRLTPHTGVSRLSRRFLEIIQDVLVVALVLVLFALMVRTLWALFKDVTADELNFRDVIAEVLFVLVMVELVRLLLVYLVEHHVAIDFMVEVGIVSTLREVVLHGVFELTWQQIAALSLFLTSLGLLLRFGDLRPRYVETPAGGIENIGGRGETFHAPPRADAGA